jgi:phosphonate transport system permease protein
VKPRFRLPVDRVVALASDWGLLLYLSYGVFFLINYWYRALVNVSPVYKVPFPTYGYAVTLAATFMLALLWENLGVSIGWKALGLVHTDPQARPLPLVGRLRRLATDTAEWALGLMGLCLFLAPVGGLGTLLYGVASQTGVSFLPGIAMWPIASWLPTMGRALALTGALAVIGVGCWFVGVRLWNFLWPAGKASASWGDRAAGTRICRVSDVPGIGRPRSWWKTTWGVMTLLLIALTIYVGWLATDVSLSTLAHRASKTGYLWKWLATPNFTYFATQDPVLRDSMLGSLIETIFMALMATVIGAVIAFPISFLGARNMTARTPVGWFVYTITRSFFNIIRSVEVIIWAVVFAVWVGFGPFAGVLALAVHTIAALGKLYSEQVEAIDSGPVEAMVASGARRWQVIRHGVIPQIVPSFLAFTLYRWDINVRMSTVIGLVGGGGIGRMLFNYKDRILWPEVGAILVIIVVVVWLMDYVSGRVRERIS